MVRAMGRLMQRQGYHATGLNQVVKESRSPKGSVYHYFPDGKEQLAAEAVRNSGQVLGQAIASMLASERSAPAAIRSVIKALAASLDASGYQYGCPIATVALEAASNSQPVREACQEVFQSWEGLLADRLVQHGFERRRAAATATVVLAAIEGGLLLARTKQDTGPLLAIELTINHLVT
jgi:TetR/AcrR family transcriptional regulator, lmrAB and yxaGH operons repressor